MVNGAKFQQTVAEGACREQVAPLLFDREIGRRKNASLLDVTDGLNTAAVISRNRAFVLSSDRRPQQEEWLGQSLATSPNGLRKGGMNPPTSNLRTLAVTKLSPNLAAVFRCERRPVC